MVELFEAVAAFANEITGSPCSFILDTQHYPYHGRECSVYALEADRKKIAIRIERHLSPMTRMKVEHQIRTLEAITRAQIPYAPRLLGFNIESWPPMIATTWADGYEMQWTDLYPPDKVRKKILRSIAGMALDLLNINSRALEWITEKIERTRTKRARRGELGEISVEDCEALQRRIFEFHIMAYDNSPHVLVHGDLHPANIIMKEGQLECVLDWGLATMVPLQFSAVYPRFLTNEPTIDGKKWDWSRCGYSQTQKDDRSFYLQCIKELAPAKGDLALGYAELLERENEQEIYWWTSAVNRLDIMKAVKSMPSSFE